jgi:hypothetical protein
MPQNIVPQAAVSGTIPVVEKRASRLITWLTGVLTLLLALFAFILSFNALTDLAGQHGVSVPPLFPFVVEFVVVIFSLNALHRLLYNEGARWHFGS